MKKPLILLLAISSVIFSGDVLPADINKGKEKSVTCVVCHGENGISVNPVWPNLAGQHPKYLQLQMVEFRKANPEFAKQLREYKLQKAAELENVKISEKLIGAKVKSWGELHSELFGAMKFERVGTLAVLSLIIVVACFNLVTTLVLIAVQKTKEFGILQVLGTPKSSIKSIIFYQGLIISMTGIISGLFIRALAIAIR